MSEVANISDIQQNTVPVEETAANKPTLAEAAAPIVTEKQVVNNNIEVEAGAGDAGTSAAEASKPAESSPKVENKKSPVKRTPSKRMSFIERAQKESEELVKNMGGSLELDGGRRTRSSARGTPTRATAVSTPPPAKKARTSPANASNTPSRGRGRGRKIDISEEAEEAKDVTEPLSTKTPEKAKTPDKKPESADKPNNTAKEISPSTDKTPASTDVIEKSTDKNTEDKTDAKDVEATSVDKHNDNESSNSKTDEEEKPVVLKNTGSPMETDEVPSVENSSTDAEAAAQPTVTDASAKDESTPAKTVPLSSTEAKFPLEEVKQLTPEPMDVDSNSKSSDVELVESVTAVPPVPSGELATAPAPASVATESTVPLTNNEIIQEVEALETDNVVEEKSSVEANNVDSIQTDGLNTSPAAPTVAVVGNAETNANAKLVNDNAKVEAITDASAGSEAIAAVKEVKVSNDESVKPENDLCVPKVVSPSINNANNDGTVTTIL